MNRHETILKCFTSLIMSTLPLSSWAQSSLPFPDPKSASVAKKTMQESTYKKSQTIQKLPKNAPNIIIMMLDDVGPAIPDTFGGDIHTPTLSKVADSGITFNRFHNTAMCSPTRAALITGRNHHRVGSGQIAELANEWEGYTGKMPATAAPIAKVLGYYGYKTAAFGKWHNTPANETTQLGPFDRWPTGHKIGFDYFYGFLAGESSQYEPAVVENTNRLPMPKKEKYHFTEDMTDKTIGWIRKVRALEPQQPFLVYWAPGAAHGPHHVAKSWADKYKGKFDDGWDKMRERIFEKQKQIGWIPQDTILTKRPSTLQAWSDIPDSEKPFQRRLMEVYAGFVEHTDTQAGRIIDELERLGIRDNTMIIYILSDNGSSAEGQNGTISELLAQNGIATKTQDHIKALNDLGGLDALGTELTDNMYHAGWAWAGSTPYQATKLVASHFGGTRTPLAISWPKKIKVSKTPHTQFHHVTDIVPTIYDVVGIQAPQTVDGFTQLPMDGVSMKYSFSSPEAPGRKKEQYFEIMGSRALYKDGWVASAFGPRIPWMQGLPPGIRTWTPDKDKWELYNIDQDFSQGKDLADKNPSQLKTLVDRFDIVAKANKVYPIGGGLWSIALHPEDAPSNPATEFYYTQDVIEIPEFTAPKLGTRSNTVNIVTELQPDSAGVLYAIGAFSGGLALWVDKGKLNFEYNLFEIERTSISTSEKLPSGKVHIEVESRVDSGVLPRSMNVSIRVNGKQFAQGKVPRVVSFGFTANDAFDVGRDSYSPVSKAYHDRAPFIFNGKIESLSVRYTKEPMERKSAQVQKSN